MKVSSTLKSVAATFGLLLCAFLFYLIFIVKITINLDTSFENSIEVSGYVEEVGEAGVKDLTFKLRNDERIYYINRGLEKEFDLKDVKLRFEGKPLNIWYAKSRQEKTNHITHIVFNNEVIYTEWKSKSVSTKIEDI